MKHEIPGSLFVIVAPSGAGKTSLVNGLLACEADVKLSISYTTRVPREGEQNGREYHFVTRENFLAMGARGEFLEQAEVYGNYYATSKKWLEETRATGADVMLEIDWQGARQVRALFPDVVYVYILPPSIDVLRERLQKRGTDSEEVIVRRLNAVQEDLRHVHEADYVIINADFGVALLDLQAVVRSQRLRANHQLKLHTLET